MRKPKQPPAQTICCPRCNTSSTCEPHQLAAFSVVQPQELVCPVYLVGGLPMVDLDEETLQEGASHKLLLCDHCGHLFRLPDWMSDTVYRTDNASMRDHPAREIAAAREHLHNVLRERNKTCGKNKKA